MNVYVTKLLAYEVRKGKETGRQGDRMYLPVSLFALLLGDRNVVKAG